MPSYIQDPFCIVVLLPGVHSRQHEIYIGRLRSERDTALLPCHFSNVQCSDSTYLIHAHVIPHIWQSLYMQIQGLSWTHPVCWSHHLPCSLPIVAFSLHARIFRKICWISPCPVHFETAWQGCRPCSLSYVIPSWTRPRNSITCGFAHVPWWKTRETHLWSGLSLDVIPDFLLGP